VAVTTLATVLVIAGLAAAVLGCAGVLLARGAADRIHYATATTLTAAPLIGAAAIVSAGPFTAGGVQTALVVLLLVAQSPLTSHVLGRLAHLERDRDVA
jgi:multisubunit Na+/H+ antiporter MnhG subunit